MYDKLSGEVQKTFVDFDATSPELKEDMHQYIQTGKLDKDIDESEVS